MLKKTLAGLMFVAVVGFAAAVEASDALKAVMTSYLEIQTALAADKVDGVKPAAAAIAKQAASMGTAGDAIAKAAKAVEDAADIKAVRTAFGPLSDAVIAAAAAEQWKDAKDAKVAYCPMVDKSWVQTGDQIRNPYYGSSMLTCGEFKKKK
jgi:hypothetical protein